MQILDVDLEEEKVWWHASLNDNSEGKHDVKMCECVPEARVTCSAQRFWRSFLLLT